MTLFTVASAVADEIGSPALSGVVSTSNSLYGTTANDLVGTGVTALLNGNYVVSSLQWSNGATAQVGAVTWANGVSGLTGAVSTSNSLYGSTANDRVGIGGVTALPNGNYVVNSYAWSNGATSQVGAVTWANGANGLAGAVSTSNSLYGTTANDRVGGGGVTALSNGNYVVSSLQWSNGATLRVGAVTWPLVTVAAVRGHLARNTCSTTMNNN